MTSPNFFGPKKVLACVALAASLASPQSVRAQFLQTGAGPFDYNDVLNWRDGVINNSFTTSLTADQTVTFAADSTLSSSWSIANTSLFNHTFVGSGADRTITLGGNVSLGSSSTNANKVTIGSTVAGQALNIALDTTRTFSVSTNRTLEIVNVISGTNGVTKTGVGILRLSGTANSYTKTTSIGASNVSAGILEVTKLANGGENSSIGASSNDASNLSFGGNTTGTLRYVGTGDSTDRRFLVGGVGAIFDASGSGAINFTNTASPNFGTPGSSPTVTLTGTNTDANSMSATFIDSGAGKTSLTKSGSGKWVLNGNSTYTGATTVSAGTLLVNGSTGVGSAVSVASGATLGGTGNIQGAVSVTGTLAPGASVESLSTGAVTFQNTSTFAVEVDSSAAVGVRADVLIVSGNLTLDGTVTMTLSDLAASPTAFALGTTFSLINYSGAWNNGVFTINGVAVADGGFFTVGLNTWQIDYNATTGGSNFSGEYLSGSSFVNVVAAVPEPGTVTMLIGGLGIAAAFAWRKRRRIS